MVSFFSSMMMVGNGFRVSDYLRLQEILRKERFECVLLCEHPPTITAGLQRDRRHLLKDVERLSALGVEYNEIPRGGSYTAHEPGQWIIYPHIDLKRRDVKPGDFVHLVLEITSQAIENIWGITLHSRREAPGLFTNSEKKIASIGIMLNSSFSSFGIALNVKNTLSTFEHIVPCGLEGIEMTSVVKEGFPFMAPDLFIDQWKKLFERKFTSVNNA